MDKFQQRGGGVGALCWETAHLHIKNKFKLIRKPGQSKEILSKNIKIFLQRVPEARPLPQTQHQSHPA